jgi:hypothetical protein
MSTVTVVLLGLVVLVGAFVAYVATRPSTFRIERSQRIRGSADSDKMIGGEFAKGLASLKRQVEDQTAAAA